MEFFLYRFQTQLFFIGLRIQTASVDVTVHTQREDKAAENDKERQREGERGAPASLVTPVGNHTLQPMAPDTHTH